MSGGHFDYQQYRIHDIATSIQELIDNNAPGKDEYGYDKFVYSAQTIEEFKKAVAALKIAEVYAQRIDWLVCGDDGEESFHSSLAEDMQALQ